MNPTSGSAGGAPPELPEATGHLVRTAPAPANPSPAGSHDTASISALGVATSTEGTPAQAGSANRAPSGVAEPQADTPLAAGSGGGVPAAPTKPPMGAETLEWRLTALERNLERLEATQLDRHSRTMTHLFSGVALLLTGVAVVTALVASWSKTELRTDLHEATAYMETRVDRSLSEMQKKFESLAGEALKKPSVLVFSSSRGPLTGKFDALPGGILSLGAILAMNVGDKKTDPISARLLSTVALTPRSG